MKRKSSLVFFLVMLLTLGSAVFNATHASQAEPALKAEPVVNINSATADELAESLVGVGKAKAEEIVRHREQHGNFGKADDLIQVKGIGESTLSKNRHRIRLE